MIRPLLSSRLVLSAVLATAAWPALAADPPTVIVVVGAEGASEYAADFNQWADRWVAAAGRGRAKVKLIGREGTSPEVAPATSLTTDTPNTDRARLRAAIVAEVGDPPATQPASSPATLPATRPPAPHPDTTAPLWLVLIGHGTYDGRSAKFNLRGPDVSDQELADWLRPAKRPLAVINASASSAPFLNRLSGPDRVVIVGTRSGNEVQFARLGAYLSAAITDPAADLDKDGQTSLLEAYLAASHNTQAFYKEAGRLATEHALLDDNGDAMGTPADWFQGTRATRSAKSGATVDGHRAHQWHLVPSAQELAMPPELRQRRDQLELEIQQLRDRKSTLAEADYYARLEPLLLELARLYAAHSAPSSTAPTDGQVNVPPAGNPTGQ